MSTQRQVKRSLNKQESKEAIGHLINVARRHEQMLHAMDQYIEQLEKHLIAKGIMTKEDVEAAANAAIAATQEAVANATKPSIKASPENITLTDSPVKIVSSCGNDVCKVDGEKKEGSYEL